MFNFEKKDLELMAQAKIKNDIEDFPLCSRFLYINEKKMLFILKSKNDYRVCSSGINLFKPVARTQTFDILFFNKNLELVKDMFRSYIARIL